MQLITLAAAAALVATVSADVSAAAFNLNSTCDTAQPKARVFNRCPYKVYLWSVLQGKGCPPDGGAVLEPGAFYQENFRYPSDDKPDVGVSIKISKINTCSKEVDNVQLEYFMEDRADKQPWKGNYHDVSYVDCLGNSCPTKKEGFYMKSGNENGQFMASEANPNICPELSCNNPTDCAKVAYIMPDDKRTKTCDLKANVDFYMCVDSPEGDYSAPSTPEEPEEEPKETSAETPKETAAPSSSAPVATSDAPAYTPEPQVQKEAVHEPNVKTEVVYVTQFEYVNAKRHAHGHRHQQFRA
ncbi:hypothetical protein BDV95DRAFT_480761 [Massariosphaeria phaeospora]|uniref:Uncharacterized protein n=1 Tax=Massariosphaeria phaeospora TaxID=100035 RepID=A0A7C8MI63_9PLEO|nr:hypothetical protein BDV95DRAFT_480761 [Massariosphaeria phaeospora]